MQLPRYKLLGDVRRERSRGKQTRNYYQRYRLLSDPARKIRTAVCFRDLQESRRRAIECVEDSIRKKVRRANPTQAFQELPLDKHVQEYRQFLDSRVPSLSPDHVARTMAQIEAIVKGCRFKHFEQIDAVKVQAWLAQRRKAKEFGERTSLYYIKAFKALCRWASRHRRFPHDPMSSVDTRTSREIAKSRERRPADLVREFPKLLKATAKGPLIHRLTGRQRMFLYLVAAQTGLRASELASLTPASFQLDGATPCVTVRCTISKHRKTDVIRLKPSLVQQLRPFLADYERDERLWPGRWFRRAAEMLRVDLKAAKIAYESPEGVLDFHALRHTFVTAAGMSGEPLPVIQSVARLSTPDLVRRYFHEPSSSHDRVLAALPDVELPKTD